MFEFERWARRVLGVVSDPIANILVSVGVTADMLTVLGFLGNVYVAVLIVQGHLVLAGVVILLAGAFDMLDGAVARASNKADRSGALLDSVIDRYSEAVVFLGLITHFFKTGHFLAVTLTFMAVTGSLLVSYIRARAEGLNIECRVGIMQRSERIVLLAVGLMLSGWQIFRAPSPLFGDTPVLVLVLAVLAVFSNLTAVHRLIFSYAELHRVHRSS